MRTGQRQAVSIVRKVVHPLAKCVKSAEMRTKRTSLTPSGGRGVRVWSRRLGRLIGLERPDYRKLNGKHVSWMLREKGKGMLASARTARCMGVPPRWVQKLWSGYGRRSGPPEPHPPRMGRPPGNGAYGRRGHSAVLRAGQAEPPGSAGLQRIIRAQAGTNVPNSVMHGMLLDGDTAEGHPRKGGRRKRVRCERERSDSPWRTYWRQLDDGRWLPCHGDGAPGFVAGYGVLGNPTAGNAPAVPGAAIRDRGSPASTMTDHGSRFCANEEEGAGRGAGGFEKHLAKLGVRQILAGVRHPRTDGRLERLHGEIQRRLPGFEAAVMRTSEPAGLPMKRYSHDRPHGSPNRGGLETPAQAFERKMPEATTTESGEKIIDTQMGGEYHAE